jgi:5-formyltetrahydrofolate cyclo-ligase
MTDTHSLNLSALRQQLRTQRATLSNAQQQQAAEQIAAHFRQQSVFAYAQHIGTYIAVQGEADPAVIATDLRAAQKQLYLPIVQIPASLRFAPWQRDTALQLNSFNIPEPVAASSALREAHTLDILLMPLLAFTDTGIRLGMGGGYYDRSLAQHVRGKPLLVGIAHEFQRQAALPEHPWDVRVDFVITEQSFYDCRR